MRARAGLAVRAATCIAALLATVMATTSCSRVDDASGADTTNAAAPLVQYFGDYARDDAEAIASLARAAGGADGQQYDTITAGTPSFAVQGSVLTDAGTTVDTLISPGVPPQVCKPFRDVIVPRRGEGVGHAVVWLTGVARGRQNTLPRRTSVRLNNCALQPRVHVVARGGTVIVGSLDGLEARFRLFDVVGDPSNPRAHIAFDDWGQVVPSPDIAAQAGLVELKDDLHAWVRGFIAVAPHPYVEVTDAGGAFRFDSLPPGRYGLVVFSERFGVARQEVVVDGADVKVSVRLK